MYFLAIEKALTNLLGGSDKDKRFYQTASAFESILRNRDLDPEEQAKAIADLIKERGSDTDKD